MLLKWLKHTHRLLLYLTSCFPRQQKHAKLEEVQQQLQVLDTDISTALMRQMPADRAAAAAAAGGAAAAAAVPMMAAAAGGGAAAGGAVAGGAAGGGGMIPPAAVGAMDMQHWQQTAAAAAAIGADGGGGGGVMGAPTATAAGVSALAMQWQQTAATGTGVRGGSSAYPLSAAPAAGVGGGGGSSAYPMSAAPAVGVGGGGGSSAYPISAAAAVGSQQIFGVQTAAAAVGGGGGGGGSSAYPVSAAVAAVGQQQVVGVQTAAAMAVGGVGGAGLVQLVQALQQRQAGGPRPLKSSSLPDLQQLAALYNKQPAATSADDAPGVRERQQTGADVAGSSAAGAGAVAGGGIARGASGVFLQSRHAEVQRRRSSSGPAVQSCSGAGGGPSGDSGSEGHSQKEKQQQQQEQERSQQQQQHQQHQPQQQQHHNQQQEQQHQQQHQQQQPQQRETSPAGWDTGGHGFMQGPRLGQGLGAHGGYQPYLASLSGAGQVAITAAAALGSSHLLPASAGITSQQQQQLRQLQQQQQQQQEEVQQEEEEGMLAPAKKQKILSQFESLQEAYLNARVRSQSHSESEQGGSAAAGGAVPAAGGAGGGGGGGVIGTAAGGGNGGNDGGGGGAYPFVALQSAAAAAGGGGGGQGVTGHRQLVTGGDMGVTPGVALHSTRLEQLASKMPPQPPTAAAGETTELVIRRDGSRASPAAAAAAAGGGGGGGGDVRERLPLTAFSDVLSEVTHLTQLQVLAKMQPSGISSSSRIGSSSSSNIIIGLDFDKKGQVFATGGMQQRICVYDYNTFVGGGTGAVRNSGSHSSGDDGLHPLTTFDTSAKLSCLSFSSVTESQLLSSDFEGGARLWDVGGEREVARWQAHEQRVWAVDFSPMSATMFASASHDGTVKVRRLVLMRIN